LGLSFFISLCQERAIYVASKSRLSQLQLQVRRKHFSFRA
jgi:hypothetical protein